MTNVYCMADIEAGYKNLWTEIIISAIKDYKFLKERSDYSSRKFFKSAKGFLECDDTYLYTNLNMTGQEILKILDDTSNADIVKRIAKSDDEQEDTFENDH